MIKRRQIHPQVQRALYRKMDALNRLRLKEAGRGTENFFVGGALEPQDNSNPIEQMLYKSTFAKVSCAVPEMKANEKGESTIVHKPISISSYITRDETGKVSQINEPISFSQGYTESPENRFRGHSGITQINVVQKEYYTQQYTIDWVCPDPVYFEDVFEPNFLKLGAYLAIEFGWGINDKGIEVEDLTVEEMKNLLKPAEKVGEASPLQERNLKSAGNYYCGVGTVTKFDWKVAADGTYTGNFQVMSMGASPLLETQDLNPASTDEQRVIKLQNIEDKIKLGMELANEGELTDEQASDLQDTIRELKKLETNTITFQAAMKNLDAVMDNYLGLWDIDAENVDTATTAALTAYGAYAGSAVPGIGNVIGAGVGLGTGLILDWLNLGKVSEKILEYAQESAKDSTSILTEADNPYSVNNTWKVKLDVATIRPVEDVFTNETSRIDYIFKDGLLRIKPIDRAFQIKNEIPEKMKKRYFASWGWFEDIILNSFFSLQSDDLPSPSFVQKIQSQSNGEVNKCFSHPHLYSMGLDSVILPSKQHPILMDGFKNFSWEDLKAAKYVYPKEERHNMTRVYHIYKLIDEHFKPFQAAGREGPALKTGPKGEPVVKQKTGDKYYYIPKDAPDTAVIVPKKTVQSLGVIRNMVFPLEMFQKHFSEMRSLRQGLRNFWSDVSNQYDGFWDFKIGQDADTTSVVGVSDVNVTGPKKPNLMENQSTKEDYYDFVNTKPDPEKTFVFSVFSKDSIVKTFESNLDLSEEAATIVRYGSNAGIEKMNGVNTLSIKAWSLLNDEDFSEETLEDKKNQYEKLRKNTFKNLKYPTDDGVGVGYAGNKFLDEQGRIIDDKSGAYFKDNPESIMRFEDNAPGSIKFAKVKKIRQSNEKSAEEIENDRVEFVKGVGIYDKFGNFSSFFRGIMTYIINSSNDDGSDSMMQKSEPLLPVRLTLELDGVGGLRVGDLFKSDFLPKRYKQYCYFMITKIDHSVGRGGWDTTVEAYMIADLPYFWTTKKSQMNAPKGLLKKIDYMEWFKKDTYTKLEERIVGGDNPTLTDYQGKFDNFWNQIDDINLLLDKWNNHITKISGIGYRVRVAVRKTALKRRIAVNMRQLERALRRVTRKLSPLGEHSITYTKRGDTFTKTGDELIEEFRAKVDEAKNKLMKADLWQPWPEKMGETTEQTNNTTAAAHKMNQATADPGGVQAGVDTQYGNYAKPTQGKIHDPKS